MTELAYQYVVLRCVPRVEREEFVNVGVVLHCQAADFLAVGWTLDAARLQAFAPDLDLDRVTASLTYVEAVCAGSPSAGAAAQVPVGTRFGFLKAPRSTVIQPGSVHGGITTDPARQLERLVHQLVS